MQKNSILGASRDVKPLIHSESNLTGQIESCGWDWCIDVLVAGWILLRRLGFSGSFAVGWYRWMRIKKDFLRNERFGKTIVELLEFGGAVLFRSADELQHRWNHERIAHFGTARPRFRSDTYGHGISAATFWIPRQSWDTKLMGLFQEKCDSMRSTMPARSKLAQQYQCCSYLKVRRKLENWFSKPKNRWKGCQRAQLFGAARWMRREVHMADKSTRSAIGNAAWKQNVPRGFCGNWESDKYRLRFFGRVI